MIIRNDKELRMFEEALDRCHHAVLLVTYRGEQFDLKDPSQHDQGIEEMMTARGYREPELFANSPADEVELFRFILFQEKEVA